MILLDPAVQRLEDDTEIGCHLLERQALVEATRTASARNSSVGRDAICVFLCDTIVVKGAAQIPDRSISGATKPDLSRIGRSLSGSTDTEIISLGRRQKIRG